MKKGSETTVVLHDGGSFTFQEATIANLVRAYITFKTHPKQQKMVCPAGNSMIERQAMQNGSSSRIDHRGNEGCAC